MTIGHTQRPIDSEMTMWALHMQAAGFSDPKKTDSPQRSASQVKAPVVVTKVLHKKIPVAERRNSS